MKGLPMFSYESCNCTLHAIWLLIINVCHKNTLQYNTFVVKYTNQNVLHMNMEKKSKFGAEKIWFLKLNRKIDDNCLKRQNKSLRIEIIRTVNFKFLEFLKWKIKYESKWQTPHYELICKCHHFSLLFNYSIDLLLYSNGKSRQKIETNEINSTICMTQFL